MSLQLRRPDYMVHAPAALIVGSFGGLTLAASLTHDVGLAWIGIILTVATGAGLRWLRHSLRRDAEELFDEWARRRGLLDDTDRPRRPRRP